MSATALAATSADEELPDYEVWKVWSPNGGYEEGPFGEGHYFSAVNHGGKSFKAWVIERGPVGSGGWAHFNDVPMTKVGRYWSPEVRAYVSAYQITTSTTWTRGAFANKIYHGISANEYTIVRFTAQ